MSRTNGVTLVRPFPHWGNDRVNVFSNYEPTNARVNVLKRCSKSCGLGVGDSDGKRTQSLLNRGMERFEDNVRESQGPGHCEYAHIIPGFAIRDSQPDQSFIELGFFERAPDTYHEVDLCAFPLSTSLRAQGSKSCGLGR